MGTILVSWKRMINSNLLTFLRPQSTIFLISCNIADIEQVCQKGDYFQFRKDYIWWMYPWSDPHGRGQAADKNCFPWPVASRENQCSREYPRRRWAGDIGRSRCWEGNWSGFNLIFQLSGPGSHYNQPPWRKLLSLSTWRAVPYFPKMGKTLGEKWNPLLCF